MKFDLWSENMGFYSKGSQYICGKEPNVTDVCNDNKNGPVESQPKQSTTQQNKPTLRSLRRTRTRTRTRTLTDWQDRVVGIP
jgi:hypothetical protein